MSKSLKIVLIILGILVIGGLGGYGYYKYGRLSIPAVVVIPSPTFKSPTPTPAISTIVDPGVGWIAPEKLGDLKLLSQSEQTMISQVTYYKVANLSGNGEIILAEVTYEGPGLPAIFRFKKGADGKYVYLVKHSKERNYETISKFLTSGVTIDSNTIYQSLSAPDFLNVRNSTLKTANAEGLFETLGKNGMPTPKEIGETAYGKIYQIGPGNTKGTVGIVYDLKQVDSTFKSYTIKFDFMTDDEVAQVTWSDGTKNTAKYTPESYTGCALTASDNAVTDISNLSGRLKVGGKTNTGDDVYLASKDDDIIKAAYDNYKLGRTQNILSIEEFTNKKPLFVWKSGLGSYIVFTGRDYAGLAECGKPVIYLYPTEEKEITIKLGTVITKSEPEYKNGWKVTANPQGEIKLGDKTYKYLYWEGTGQEYALLNEGTVVAKRNVQSTIEKQLRQLGLSDNEIADFIEFWMPKMPNAPYVRLTWFGNRLMDQLAPIAVSPKPDTIIRVFLDFEGLQNKIDLPAQKLSAPERKGFTVVEWGGLLRK